MSDGEEEVDVADEDLALTLTIFFSTLVPRQATDNLWLTSPCAAGEWRRRLEPLGTRKSTAGSGCAGFSHFGHFNSGRDI